MVIKIKKHSIEVEKIKYITEGIYSHGDKSSFIMIRYHDKAEPLFIDYKLSEVEQKARDCKNIKNMMERVKHERIN